MTEIDKILDSRQDTYGDFKVTAAIAQKMKDAIVAGPAWDSMTPEMKEALEQVCSKVSRIVAGDPNFHDSWHDIVGYVTLVERSLQPNLFNVEAGSTTSEQGDPEVNSERWISARL